MGNSHPDLSCHALQFPTSASHFPKLTGSPQAQPFGEHQDREQGARGHGGGGGWGRTGRGEHGGGCSGPLGFTSLS